MNTQNMTMDYSWNTTDRAEIARVADLIADAWAREQSYHEGEELHSQHDVLRYAIECYQREPEGSMVREVRYIGDRVELWSSEG